MCVFFYKYYILQNKCFLILHQDKIIFEQTYTPQKLQTYFVVHSALDSLAYILKQKRDFYIGYLKSEDSPIFCLMNGTRLKMVLIWTHRREFDRKVETTIKDFFIEVNRNLTNVLMNPLYELKQQIRSPSFTERVGTLAIDFLRPYFEKKNDPYLLPDIESKNLFKNFFLKKTTVEYREGRILLNLIFFVFGNGAIFCIFNTNNQPLLQYLKL